MFTVVLSHGAQHLSGSLFCKVPDMGLKSETVLNFYKFINALIRKNQMTALKYLVKAMAVQNMPMIWFLVSLTKNGLQNLMDKCCKNSLMDRYLYNDNKSNVLVVNEPKSVSIIYTVA